MANNWIPVYREEQINTVAALADRIWTEHYSGLLPEGQTAYMVEKYQTADAIRRQMEEEDYRYFLVDAGNGPVGYTAIQVTGNRMFLSKIYIDKAARRQGLASFALSRVEDLCRKERLSAVWLTVNRHNEDSIAAYKALGFSVIDTQVTDIGNGYVMDDYIMEKPVEGAGTPTAMKLRPFGHTGTRVSALGFGAMRMPTLPDGSIDEPEAIAMIRAAIDNGVNYIDTAYFYHGGKSEELVGKALKDGYREKVYVATKNPFGGLNSPEEYDQILDEQLSRLDCGYIDFYLFHAISLNSWKEKILALGLLKKAEEARAAGKIRHIGFSFHDDNAAFHEVIDGYDGWEFCQIQYNYIDVCNQAGTEGLEYAASKGLGVVVMEPLLGGKLANPPESVRRVLPTEKTPVEWALDFLWDRPEVSLLLSGMSTAQQVQDNLLYSSRCEAGMLTEEQRALFADAKVAYDTMARVPCTKCVYCMPCPFGVNIPGVFEAYNRSAFSEDQAREQYAALEGQGDLCRSCGKCEKKCPQQIAIRQQLAEAHALLKEQPAE